MEPTYINNHQPSQTASHGHMMRLAVILVLVLAVIVIVLMVVQHKRDTGDAPTPEEAIQALQAGSRPDTRTPEQMGQELQYLSVNVPTETSTEEERLEQLKALED